MSKMNDMAMTIEELRNAATAINDTANWLAQQFGGTPETAEKAGGTGIVKKQKKLEQVLHFIASCAMLASERNSADLWKRKRALSVPVSADRR